MNYSLGLDPLLPWWLIAGAAALLAAAAALLIWQRQRGALLRLGAGVLVIAALTNPSILSEERAPLKSTVALVVDESQSQKFGTRSEDSKAALEALKAKLARFPEFDVRTVSAGKAAEDGTQDMTRIFPSINEAFRDVSPSRIGGVVVLSDGQVHDVPQDPAKALGFNAPVHVLLSGREGEFDRVVRFIESPKFGITGKPLRFVYRVDDDGIASPAPVRVEVFLNGEKISEQTVQPGNNSDLDVEIARAGNNILELRAETVPGEVSDNNNAAVANVDGIRENLRVLLVSGEPHAGERTWRNLLKSDASVDLVHFTILRPPEKQDGTPINELSLIAFPTRELFVEKIKDFDLIIFDRYQHRDVLPVLYYDYIAQYVEDGGALLIAAGPEYDGPLSIAETPLSSVLPAMPSGGVNETAFYPRLTDTGKRHPVTRGLEGSTREPPQWSRWFRIVDVGEPQGNVVMKGANDQPLLILNRKGKGRVGMFLSDQGWLWARNFEGGGPYVSLYRRIAHWLMAEPELEEEALNASGTGNSVEITRQTMADTAGVAEVTAPSGKVGSVNLKTSEPGLFKGKLETAERGLFSVKNGDLTTLVHVGAVDAPEFKSIISTPAVLEPVAKATGGSIRRIANVAGAISVPDIVPVRANGEMSGAGWIGLVKTSETQLLGVSRLPLFSGLLGLALLIAAISAMWWREGR